MTFGRSRTICRAALAGACLLLPVFSIAQATQKPEPEITSAPGTVVRWRVAGAARCAMKARTWAALDGTCYYPIDLLERPGRIAISVAGSGPKQFAHIVVEAFDYGTEDITLPEIPQANPTRDDLRRDAIDRAQLVRIWHRRETAPEFTLPLGPPVRPLPPGKSFGVKRIFNGKVAEHVHTGSDYDAPVGSPILAVANGTVVLAKEMFFEGNAVFIDHGDGLISEYFHLSEIKVTDGQVVKKGETLGREGSTGRATGPHLWFGVRWHDARINPKFMLEEPVHIPSVNKAAQ